jgi:hypothetical protein
MIFNIYNINPDYYTRKATLGGDLATEKEYAIAETMSVSSPYYSYNGISNAIYDIQGIEFKKIKKISEGVLDPITTLDFFNKSNFAIINKNMYLQYLPTEKLKSPITYNRTVTVLSYENFYNVNKICDLDGIFILTWKK